MIRSFQTVPTTSLTPADPAAHIQGGKKCHEWCCPSPTRLIDDPNYDTRPKPATHKATWPRIELPLHFPAEKLNSRLSINRLSRVRRQPRGWRVMDGAAVWLVINTAPRLNKADSFAPITFEPLKPSVNCICLQAEVYSRLFAKSRLICGDNSNILQAPGRYESHPRMASRGLHHGSLHAAHPPEHSASVPGKDKNNTDARIVTPALPPAVCVTPAKSPGHGEPLFSPERRGHLFS